MALDIRNPRFVVRPDDADDGFAWWSLEFDGKEFATATHSAPRDDVYEFLRWLKEHAREIEVSSTGPEPTAHESAGRHASEPKSPRGGYG